MSRKKKALDRKSKFVDGDLFIQLERIKLTQEKSLREVFKTLLIRDNIYISDMGCLRNTSNEKINQNNLIRKIVTDIKTIPADRRQVQKYPGRRFRFLWSREALEYYCATLLEEMLEIHVGIIQQETEMPDVLSFRT